MNSSTESPTRRFLELALVFWALSTGLFFLIRFSFEFYRANQAELARFWSTLGGQG